MKKTFLCITFYFKGNEFLQQCKAEGNTVFLLTKKKLENKPWAWESIDEVFYMESDENSPENINNLIKGVAWLMRKHKIDRVVALDDFDVEKAAAVREEFRIPGMGQTTARYFRDKLAMRIKARNAGLRVPAFSPLFNDEEINLFANQIPTPWLVKPRSEASATGIRKVHSTDQLWEVIHQLGDKRHMYLVEQFKPGDVYHVDALTINGEMAFNWTSKYLSTPFDVAHGAGIFRSATLPHNSDDDILLKEFNNRVMKAFGMKNSASHTEYIKCHEDGEFYFLETSARVGGAHLGTMVEAASGINLWREWARLESALLKGEAYQLPEVKRHYSGILISLARQQHPDLSPFNDPEIYCHIPEEHHVALIIHSSNHQRIIELLDKYAQIVKEHYHASAPVPDKPSH
ncbi:ATPase [Schleiferia thermophila str. Yellowstone]|uniref:ATP-grasp domain-containing protein n=1 Tax=Schleiferia thermophila TaxID=884107 RepID=UPI0004E727AD|nr:ATP-grasp domain-containing protein [Schleiferia thermophila]KFD38504.1 ATPase [Schleiferia thermophila str. Yellowstone]